MPIDELIEHFANYIPLKDLEKAALVERVTERRVKRRQFILQENDACKHYTFVVSGCFKMYAVDLNGKEHNLEFAAENSWITNLSSFYAEQPGSVYIEAIEPATILQIKHEDLIYLYMNYPKFNSSFRIIIERKYIELQNRVLQNISATADERYLHFLQQYPELSNRLPNTQIASYLGITSEFLSKIRKNLTQKR